MKWYSINSIVTVAHQLRIEGFVDVSHDLLVERLQMLNAAHLPNGADKSIQPACSNCRKEYTSSCPSLRKELCDYYERRVS